MLNEEESLAVLEDMDRVSDDALPVDLALAAGILPVIRGETVFRLLAPMEEQNHKRTDGATKGPGRRSI